MTSEHLLSANMFWSCQTRKINPAKISAFTVVNQNGGGGGGGGAHVLCPHLDLPKTAIADVQEIILLNIWRVWIQKLINANFKVHHQIEQNKTFSISHSLHNKEYFWSYDETYDPFSFFPLFFSIFNRKYLKLIKMDVSVLNLNSSFIPQRWPWLGQSELYTCRISLIIIFYAMFCSLYFVDSMHIVYVKQCLFFSRTM